MIDQLDDVQWGKLLAEAWIDPEFKARLEHDPGAAIRSFASREFGLELDGDFDSLTIPDPPMGMEGEHLSGSAGAAGTITGCASAGGDVQGTISGCASAGGNVQGTITGCASAGGDVQGTITGCASAGGN